MVIFALLALVLSQAWTQLDDGIRWAFVTGAIVAPAAAWLFLKVVLTGVSPFPVHRPLGTTGKLLWAAALGDTQASATLQATREQLRAALDTAVPPTPEHCAGLRGIYSITLTDAEQLLADVSPDNVVLSGGTPEGKATIIHRLEAEIITWRADYQWFEHVVDRHPA